MITEKCWKLNGTPLGEFKGLSEETIKTLKYVGTFYGVECFSTTACPKGTLELFDRGERVAVITGLGEK